LLTTKPPELLRKCSQEFLSVGRLFYLAWQLTSGDRWTRINSTIGRSYVSSGRILGGRRLAGIAFYAADKLKKRAEKVNKRIII
jgi:hypothetical protein